MLKSISLPYISALFFFTIQTGILLFGKRISCGYRPCNESYLTLGIYWFFFLVKSISLWKVRGQVSPDGQSGECAWGGELKKNSLHRDLIAHRKPSLEGLLFASCLRNHGEPARTEFPYDKFTLIPVSPSPHISSSVSAKLMPLSSRGFMGLLRAQYSIS